MGNPLLSLELYRKSRTIHPNGPLIDIVSTLRASLLVQQWLLLLGATYPDIFAAIGVHSGAEYGAITSPLSGGLTFLQGGPDPIQQGRAAFAAMGSFARVVPTIVFHGTVDPVSWPINGDKSCSNGWKQIFYRREAPFMPTSNIPAVP